MYKDKDKQREAARLAMRRHREGITEGITQAEGITSSPTSEGITGEEGITSCPVYHILDKLTDSKWKENLTYLCSHLRQSDKEVTWLGDVSMVTVCDWLECTLSV